MKLIPLTTTDNEPLLINFDHLVSIRQVVKDGKTYSEVKVQQAMFKVIEKPLDLLEQFL